MFLPELFNKWIRGDKSACQTLTYILHYGPMLTKELMRMFGPVVIVPIPRPWPGPNPPLLDSNFLQMGEVIRVAMGDPNPQPSLKGAKEMRSAMERMIKTLDAEIARLNPKSKT